LPLLPRPELKDIPVGIHGGPDNAELKSLGLDCDRILDFSVCCNPYRPPKTVRESLRRIRLNVYPDSQASELRSKIALELGIPINNILAGNGTTELIRLIAAAYFNKGDRVLIPKPTYGEYETASRISGAGIIEFQWKRQEKGRLNINDLKDVILRERPRAVFLGNPNNPSGHYLSREEIDTIVSSLGETLLIIDEAYINFVEDSWSSLPLIKYGQTIILRSMTKDYGLASLRLGYAIAGEDIINNLGRVCPPWNVNTAAQKAGTAALEEEEFLKQSQKRIGRAKQYLLRELAQSGFKVLPSAANFFLVKVESGKEFRKALLEQGILVRDCASFGLPDYIRIAPGTMADCRRLIKAIKKLKMEGVVNAVN
jgi:histidinol-phosphate aminotransferase